MTNDLIAELARLHHRATDLRAREAQLADAGENDPASDTWKTAAIVAASAEGEFEAALVEAWPALARLLREADQWRARESETQEALQAIGEEFGVNGGEPRVDGIRRVLAEKEKALAIAGATLMKLDQTNAELQAHVLREAAEKPRYFLSRDNDGHWYIVPVAMAAEWEAWSAIPEDDERAWDAPEFAHRVGGAPCLVTFTTPHLEGRPLPPPPATETTKTEEPRND